MRALGTQIPGQSLEQCGFARLPGGMDHEKLFSGDQPRKLR